MYKTFTCICLLVVVAQCIGKNVDNTRIVGGSPARAGQFPHQVSILKRNLLQKTHWCGGSILNERFILTAAHCLDGQTLSGFFVRAGDLDLSQTSEWHQEVTPSRFILHPAYDASRTLNDVALVELSTPLDLSASNNVKPIALPEPGFSIGSGEECAVSGWGATEEGAGTEKVLRFVYVPTLSDEECLRDYPNQVDASMLCAGFPTGGADSCSGDSGGPLSCGDVKDTVHGIVSWGFGCARPGYPGVYTEVSYFTEWIRGVIQQV